MFGNNIDNTTTNSLFSRRKIDLSKEKKTMRIFVLTIMSDCTPFKLFAEPFMPMQLFI